MTPSRVLLTIASWEEFTIAVSKAALSSASCRASLRSSCMSNLQYSGDSRKDLIAIEIICQNRHVLKAPNYQKKRSPALFPSHAAGPTADVRSALIESLRFAVTTASALL